jgi:hypothetical protein
VIEPKLIFAALCVLLGSGGASATVFPVATAADLSAAVRAAKGGDTIALNGTFGATNIKHHYWTSTVTLDATHATFTDTLGLSDLNNLTVVGGNFGSPTAPEVYGEAIYVNTVDQVAFVNPTVVGNFLTGGIGILASTNVAVTGGSFSTVHKAIGLSGVTNAVIDRNIVTGSTGDGFQAADSHNVRLTSNQCVGGTPLVGDHPDCIQLWSIAGNAPVSDIVIDNNYANGGTQGFTEFNHDQGGALRITITGNTIAGYFPQGIACYDCVDSTITGNTLISLPGAAHWVNLNIIGGSNNIVSGNTITGYDRTKAQPTQYWTLAELLAGAAPPDGGTAVVPEPAAWSTMAAGFGAVGARRRRRREAAIA